MSLVHNEQIKLTATYLNTLAVAMAVVGGITPVVAIAYGFQPTSLSAVAALGLSFGWFAVSFAIHWRARTTLRRLLP